ncbi:hypothetical protein LTR97_006507 [Elasticomyces elasticus]|uniref:Uncharacterized protein n=1 Tax=Elasticomyces elasticus TaxID=574655 RepID=A0AAN7ZN86_9PEZI|nr:hypothetical protein LTR97_006507 [Elasticomyces elasticus]
MDMNPAKEPSPNKTETAPQQTWDRSSIQLRNALADFEYVMKVCTEASEKVRKRLSTVNAALPSFAIDAEYAALAGKAEAVTRDVVKKSSQFLSEVKSFADKRTECSIYQPVQAPISLQVSAGGVARPWYAVPHVL